MAICIRIDTGNRISVDAGLDVHIDVGLVIPIDVGLDIRVDVGFGISIVIDAGFRIVIGIRQCAFVATGISADEDLGITDGIAGRGSARFLAIDDIGLICGAWYFGSSASKAMP
jgi:hypothetical protein